MDLSKITLFAFHEKHSQIYKQFQVPGRLPAILDTARREIPLVDGLLGLMRGLDELPEDKRSDLFERIMHDVHMMITLWSLLNPSVSILPPAPGQASTPPIEDQSFRLRRYGTN